MVVLNKFKPPSSSLVRTRASQACNRGSNPLGGILPKMVPPMRYFIAVGAPTESRLFCRDERWGIPVGGIFLLGKNIN